MLVALNPVGKPQMREVLAQESVKPQQSSPIFQSLYSNNYSLAPQVPVSAPQVPQQSALWQKIEEIMASLKGEGNKSLALPTLASIPPAISSPAAQLTPPVAPVMSKPAPVAPVTPRPAPVTYSRPAPQAPPEPVEYAFAGAKKNSAAF